MGKILKADRISVMMGVKDKFQEVNDVRLNTLRQNKLQWETLGNIQRIKILNNMPQEKIREKREDIMRKYYYRAQ